VDGRRLLVSSSRLQHGGAAWGATQPSRGDPLYLGSETKGNIMKKIGAAVLAGALLVLSGCGSSPKDLIIGKWESKEKIGDKEITITMEFTKDKIKTSMGSFSSEGSYKWVDNDNIEVTAKGLDDKEVTEKTKVKVTDKELELTDKDGKTKKFTKAK
jgi:hypothetical protein